MILLLLIWLIGTPTLLMIGIIMVCVESSRKSGLKVLLVALTSFIVGASICGMMC